MKVNMRIGTRILAGYGMALVVVGIVGVVAYRATTELVDSADWVTHSHKVKEAVFEVRSSLKDAETGQRGFPPQVRNVTLSPIMMELRRSTDISRKRGI